jgi:hypothetical protein
MWVPLACKGEDIYTINIKSFFHIVQYHTFTPKIYFIRGYEIYFWCKSMVLYLSQESLLRLISLFYFIFIYHAQHSIAMKKSNIKLILNESILSCNC